MNDLETRVRRLEDTTSEWATGFLVMAALIFALYKHNQFTERCTKLGGDVVAWTCVKHDYVLRE